MVEPKSSIIKKMLNYIPAAFRFNSLVNKRKLYESRFYKILSKVTKF